MIGYIKLQRDILEWEWYQNPVAVRLAIHLLLRANFKEKNWQGIIIKRGQLVTSNKHLSQDLDLSIQQIRTALNKLKSSAFLTIKTTNKYTLLTITNYNSTQSREDSTNTIKNIESTVQQQSNNKPTTTTKESKKDKKVNKEKIERRKLNFKNHVFKHSNYSNNILTPFFNYWSEIDENSNKMKFEKQSAFEVEIRLKSWKKKDQEWGKKLNEKYTISTNR